MPALLKRKTERLKVLYRLYQRTDGQRSVFIDSRALSREVGFALDDTCAVVDYLVTERLVEYRDGGGLIVGMTLDGILEVERAITHPSTPTKHFPAIKSALSFEGLPDTQFEQDSCNRIPAQVVTKVDVEIIREMVHSFREKLPALPLKPCEKVVAATACSELMAQVRPRTPKVEIVRKSLQTLKSLAEGAESHGLAKIILASFDQLLHLMDET